MSGGVGTGHQGRFICRYDAYLAVQNGIAGPCHSLLLLPTPCRSLCLSTSASLHLGASVPLRICVFVLLHLSVPVYICAPLHLYLFASRVYVTPPPVPSDQDHTKDTVQTHPSPQSAAFRMTEGGGGRGRERASETSRWHTDSLSGPADPPSDNQVPSILSKLTSSESAPPVFWIPANCLDSR